MPASRKSVRLSPTSPIGNDTTGDVSGEALLALLLRRGLGAAAAARLAGRLLERFGGIRKLLNANPDDLMSVKGLGRGGVATVHAVRELACRYFEETLPIGEAIRSPEDTKVFLLARLRDRPHEVFCCLYLDNRHRILAFEELFRGTIDGTSVYPREVVKQALALNAAAIILAHNHPSGVAEPSQADERITRRVKSALELVDIRLLDHLIIGDGVSTSLASRGML
jgi:DNA repair protein RadC